MLPEGTGRVNPAGLDFYDRLVDALLESGIQPMRHALSLGPARRARRSRRLAESRHRRLVRRLRGASMFRRLDDRVKMWATLNEPWVVTDGGYLHGALAPGHRNLFEAPIASHNLLRSHAMAVQAYRAEGRHQIGPGREHRAQVSRLEGAGDLAATARADAYMNRQYLDPVFHGALSGGAEGDLRRGVARVARGGLRRSSASRSISSA